MDYYEELELSVRCTKDEIKKSFKRLAMIHHPDKGGNEEKFKQAVNIYEIFQNGCEFVEYLNSTMSTQETVVSNNIIKETTMNSSMKFEKIDKNIKYL